MIDEKLTYLAIPYTGIEEYSFEVCNKVAGALMNRGFTIFSPISHSHTIAEMCEMPTEWSFWEKQDRLFISRCDEIIVICLDGWDKSRGVTAELEIAEEQGITIRFFDVEETATDEMTVTERGGKNRIEPIHFGMD